MLWLVKIQLSFRSFENCDLALMGCPQVKHSGKAGLALEEGKVRLNMNVSKDGEHMVSLGSLCHF